MTGTEIYLRLHDRTAYRDLSHGLGNRRLALVESMNEYVLAATAVALVTALSFAIAPFTGYESRGAARS
jgi:hypothetical protein